MVAAAGATPVEVSGTRTALKVSPGSRLSLTVCPLSQTTPASKKSAPSMAGKPFGKKLSGPYESGNRSSADMVAMRVPTS